jgi:hypothetical protein
MGIPCFDLGIGAGARLKNEHPIALERLPIERLEQMRLRNPFPSAG